VHPTTTRARNNRWLHKRKLEPYKPNIRPGAKYVSDSGQEYVIVHDADRGSFWIKRYKGGNIHDHLRGFFTSETEAERVLISYLSVRDKMNRAIWPGKINGRDNFVKTVGE